MTHETLLHGVLRAAENTIALLERTMSVVHPDLDPELEHVDYATRTLLFAADALSFAIARYRAEHQLAPDQLPSSGRP
jgi:hypothetical protein